MKKLVRLCGMILGTATVAVALSGCCASDQAFVTAADTYAYGTVGEEYLAYVGADTNLTPAEKDDRVFAVNSFRRAVDEAKAKLGQGGGD